MRPIDVKHHAIANGDAAEARKIMQAVIQKGIDAIRSVNGR